MTVGTLAPKAEDKKPMKKKEVADENVPLLPKTQETDAEFHEFNGASFSGAVFNLSTTVIGAGIMGLPACVKKLGMVPGLLAIILTALLTEKAIEFMIRFSRAGNISSYGSLMGDAFGKYGKAAVELCIVIGNIGILIVYMIIIVFYAVRVNIDGLIFSSSRRPLLVDNFRFASITIALVGTIFLGANFIPNIWVIFQFAGATSSVCIAFIFPAAITLRDRYNIATKTDRIMSLFMIVLAVLSNAIAIYSDAYALINKKKT
ncbi:hypothetical protein TSUD_276810 [Trifolium subterraneum]|uniref:Amino acid transporter transmembrane domain-containing protein n=1 Tax=Trifolium subterraneum TaxID=3900 RepID=A0A2Z6NQ35_TRISU|nr:hypothetical protein TSUD_276810 [Trifolium subterraneum]